MPKKTTSPPEQDQAAPHSDGPVGPEEWIRPSDVVLMGNFPPGPTTMTLDDTRNHMSVQTGEDWPKTIMVTKRQAEVLEKILERDVTAWVSHGGLAGLLSMTDQEISIFKDLVTLIKKW